MASERDGAGGYAQVNGLELYYERHGEGAPLILLHGGLGAGQMYAEGLLPSLAAGREVILVDMQGHGRTADIDRPLALEAMADDVAGLIQHLGLGRTDVMGYSMGGGAAVQTAIRHPQLVRKLVAVSFPIRREAWYPAMLAGMDQMGEATAEMLKQSPIYALYAAIAPRPGDWPRLLGKMGELLRREYDWTADVAAIAAPTLVVSGDADSFPTAHAAEIFGLLGGDSHDGGWDGSGMPTSRLSILPATTHYDIFDSPLLPPIVVAFLDAPAH